MTTATPPASSINPNPLNDRVHFKLNAARQHLDRLRELEADSEGRTLVSSDVRTQAEIEIDEFFYQLVGVKDALLQEINRELNLGLAFEEVKEGAINRELEQKLGVEAINDLMNNINKMKSKKTHPLGKINELYNHSKHRAMLKKNIVSADGGISNFSLIDPITEEPMNNQIIDYLTDSYERIENLQKTVRENIPKYLPKG